MIPKHLIGHHNQKTHGRSKLHIEVAPGIDNLPSPLTRLFSVGGAGMLPRSSNNFPTDREERDAKKALMVSISERTGIPASAVNELIAAWANSPICPDSVIIRHAVAEEFGRSVPEYEEDLRRLSTIIPISNAMGEARRVDKQSYPYGESTTTDEELAKRVHTWSHIFVKDVYSQTQKFLAENGIKELTLHRGIGYYGKSKEATDVPNEVVVNDKSLSSWTTELGTALGFGNAVVTTIVPASDVFSMARLGPGSLPEAEVLLLGDKRRCPYHLTGPVDPQNDPLPIKERLIVAGKEHKVYEFADMPENLKPAILKYGIVKRGEYVGGLPMILGKTSTPQNLPPGYFYYKTGPYHEPSVGKWVSKEPFPYYVPAKETGILSTGWGDGSLPFGRVNGKDKFYPEPDLV